MEDAACWIMRAATLVSVLPAGLGRPAASTWTTVFDTGVGTEPRVWMGLMVTGEAPERVWLSAAVKSLDFSCSFSLHIWFPFSLSPPLTCFLQSFASCVCPPGFTGVYCEQDFDYCADHRCSEHGVCLDQQNNYTCLCMPGFEGPLCQLETNECDSVPCAHGATCVDLISDYHCQCPPGFEGENTNVSQFTAGYLFSQ